MKKKIPQLVVMLTHHDMTVENAEEVFEQCKDTRALYWGMKEKPLSEERMKALFRRMKECGKRTALEVVSYDEEGARKGAELAVRCGCDIVMGTKFSSEVCDYLHSHSISYLPFVGTAIGRPSVLTGSPEEILAEAAEVVARGADGVDLLGYRYVGDARALNTALCHSLDAPVCIAGSIDSRERIDEVKEAGADTFTIGSAFFDGRFGGSFAEQVDAVCEHLDR